ncbi:hypothetical protein QE177_04480 [Arsenophonus sp. aPb]|uniref:hypothetical protein n=1 Tax=Arsenophonus sp. aPb TaxID=3041619 RepID=UPI00246845AD|nr:hypothetical protein [Arsenophonus sp. aPb]WGL99142.1 hypothetical protein QE177_04480 [Arsenophonus sp. aPb]
MTDFKIAICCFCNKILGLYEHKYNNAWDVELNKMIDNCEVIQCNEFRISFKTGEKITEVWIGNPFYAYANKIKDGHLSYSYFGGKHRPSYKTMKKLYRLVESLENKKWIA